MKSTILFLSIALATMTGCDFSSMDYSSDQDTRMVTALQEPPVDNAIVAQRTLYPYHFVMDSAALNDLGQRDMDILACHFKNKTGQINVYRGDTPEPLYQARLMTVTRALANCSISAKTVKVGDGLPGGDGISSERAILVLERDKQPMIVTDSSTSGMSGTTGLGGTSTGSHP